MQHVCLITTNILGINNHLEQVTIIQPYNVSTPLDPEGYQIVLNIFYIKQQMDQTQVFQLRTFSTECLHYTTVCEQTT
jgi:hypothetical protein